MGSGITEKMISVIVNLTDRFTVPMKKIDRQMKRSNKAIDTQSNAMAKQNLVMASTSKAHRDILSNVIARGKATVKVDKLSKQSTIDNRIAQSGFGRVLGMNKDIWTGFNKRQKQFATLGGRTANRIRVLTHGMRGFRMEMLGVMFFGMAMNRMFMGLIKTSLDWFGVFEIMSMGLGLLFLPLAEKLLEWAIKFLQWVAQLTPEQKKWINIMVAAAIVIGTVLTVIGTLALGLGSLLLAFNLMFTPIGMVVTALLGLAGLAFLSKMFGDFEGAVGAAEEKLVAFGVSGDLITALKDKVSGALEALKGMVPEFITTGFEIARKIVEGIAQYFADNPLVVLGAIIGGLIGGPAGIAIGSALGTLFSNIEFSEIEEIIDAGLQTLQTILDGMLENFDLVEDVFVALMESMGEWIGRNIPKLMKLGFMIATAIIEGMMKGILQALMSLASKIPGLGKNDKFRNMVESLGPPPSIGDGIIQNGKIITTHPEDTIMAFKDPSIFGGGGSDGGSVTNNFYGFTMEELKRELDSRDRQLVADMERNR
jgi:hypothetical protein